MKVRYTDKVTGNGLLVDDDGTRLKAIQGALRANDRYGHPIGNLTKQLLDLVVKELHSGTDVFTVEFADGQEFTFILQGGWLDQRLYKEV